MSSPPPYSLLNGTLHSLSQGTYIPLRPPLCSLNSLTILSPNFITVRDDMKRYLYKVKNNRYLKIDECGIDDYFLPIDSVIYRLNASTSSLTTLNGSKTLKTYPKFNELTIISSSPLIYYTTPNLHIYSSLTLLHSLPTLNSNVLTPFKIQHDNGILELEDKSKLYIHLNNITGLPYASHKAEEGNVLSFNDCMSYKCSGLNFIIVKKGIGLIMINFTTTGKLIKITHNNNLNQVRNIDVSTIRIDCNEDVVWASYEYGGKSCLSCFRWKGRSVNRLSCGIGNREVEGGKVVCNEEGCAIKNDNCIKVYDLKGEEMNRFENVEEGSSFLVVESSHFLISWSPITLRCLGKDGIVEDLTENIEDTITDVKFSIFLKGGSTVGPGFSFYTISTLSKTYYNIKHEIGTSSFIVREGSILEGLINEASKSSWYVMNCKSQEELKECLVNVKVAKGHLNVLAEEGDEEECWKVLEWGWRKDRDVKITTLSYCLEVLGEEIYEFLLKYLRSLEPKVLRKSLPLPAFEGERGHTVESLCSECARRGNARGASLGLGERDVVLAFFLDGF
ncbi:hypothetical protein TrLO_g4670 [Triparma laevis f. longispina]|uniref:Uncharacterized protein n=1 Tax=Triparma laevis f. longispina TaxID=1714387 RepID=A0A9W7CMN3_9STRA|nr:hypothetical protein TrLO_g4670 [Triparma laevis f. longispina]